MSQDTERNVLVTGATGLAGSSTIKGLLREFHDISVTAIHNRDDGFFIEDPRVKYKQGDLRVIDDCRRVARGCNQAVLAAAITGGAMASVSKPWEQVTDNVVMDCNILAALHEQKVGRIIYISTSSVYQPHTGRISEDDLDLNIDPHNAHMGVGWAKRYIEKQCEFWFREFGTQFGIIRSSNLYGPYAKFHPQRSNFVVALIRKAVERNDPYEVWGSVDVTRDILFADDLGSAVAKFIGLDNLEYETLNVGSGSSVSVGDVVNFALQAASHKPSKILYRGNAPTTAQTRELDCSRAQKVLGWQALISPAEGIQLTSDWWQENKDRWQR